MMHPHHNMHPQAMSGHPGQHINPHSMPGPGPTHHQMGPPQMHRDQNRMMNQSVGVNVGVRMGGNSGPPTRPPRQLMPAMPPSTMHHRPPPPPRHLPHHSPIPMQPPPPPRPGVMMSMGQPINSKSMMQQPTMPMHQQSAMQPPHHSNMMQQHNNIQIITSNANNKQYGQSQQQHANNYTSQPQQPNCHKTPHGEPIISTAHKQPILPQQQMSNMSSSNDNSCTNVNPSSSPTLGNSQHSPNTSVAPQESNNEEGDTSLLSTSDNDSQENVANSKEKTSMCLVNELARFNKIQHQYRLTSESGPAHRKRFIVSLRLGGGEGGGPVEEYSAEGSRIRTAQHAAAAEALKKTSYPKPSPKPPRAQRSRRTSSTIMPTVELNALTMKLGENAIYTMEGPVSGGQVDAAKPGWPVKSLPDVYRPATVQVHGFNRNSRYYNQNNKYPNSRFNQNKYPNSQFKMQGYSGTYHVKLTVGGRIYRGEGNTPQLARHDAASQALKDLKQYDQDQSEVETLPVYFSKNYDDIKSPVSVVHEVALKLNYPVSFFVKSEKGPPHMKTFITTCTVAEHVTEGNGSSKKKSKKKAAENMLEELKKVTSIKKAIAQPDNNKKVKRKQQQPKKRTRNLIKVDEKTDSNSATDSNPIAKLLQWAMSTGGGKEPTYIMVGQGEVPTNSGIASRRRCFSVACEVARQKTLGMGPSKKSAKRDAANKMLNLLAVTSQKTDSEQLDNSTSNAGDRSNTSPSSLNTSASTSATAEGGSSSGVTNNNKGRQLVPGVLLVQDHTQQQPNSAGYVGNKNGVSPQTTAMIAKEFLRAGNSPTADALAKQEHSQKKGSSPGKPISSPLVSSTTPSQSSTLPQTSQVIRPKDQLLYLAQLLGFQVQFTDFLKGNHGEFLSLVTLSTQPPMVCHGVGPTTEQSHDKSALLALQSLSQMGLDNVTPSTKQQHQGQQQQQEQSQEGHPIVNLGNRTNSNTLTNGISK